MSTYKLCILCAGKGTRLGTYTTNLNKGLVKIGNKAAISHIIEKVPIDTEIVLALGFQGNLVKEYCLAMYPERTFNFIVVPEWDGPNSGPGTSMLACKEHLKCPFYLSTVDCIVDYFPNLDNNWIGLYPTDNPKLYATASLNDNLITDFKNKNNYGYSYAFIGLAGIVDYNLFFNSITKDSSKEVEFVSAFYSPEDYPLYGHILNWEDTGSLDGLKKAELKYSSNTVYGMPKNMDEITYINNGYVVKYIGDLTRINGRIERAEILKYSTPHLTFSGTNFYAYKLVPGKTLYEVNDIKYCNYLFDWCKLNLWKSVEYPNFHIECNNFYQHKTLARLESFLSKKDITFKGTHIINGIQCRNIYSYLEDIDWSLLSRGIPSTIHGDLQFDNVILSNNDLILIDWREDFGGSTKVGDLYYDLAKMYGGYILNYNLMKDSKNYSVDIIKNNVTVSYTRTKELDNTIINFKNKVGKNYDLYKVRLITALVWLSMAPLHEEVLGELLFFKAKLMLESLLQ